MKVRRFSQLTRFEAKGWQVLINVGRIVGSRGTNLAASPRVRGQDPDLSCKAYSAEDKGSVPQRGKRDRGQLRCATSSMGVAGPEVLVDTCLQWMVKAACFLVGEDPLDRPPPNRQQALGRSSVEGGVGLPPPQQTSVSAI